MPENEILNPSLQGLGTDPFGLQGYTYSTSLWNKKNARNAAKAEAAYNAKTNYAYWVANNLYNSPAAQMARFVDAGLNPNLIYGKENNVVAGNSPNAHGQVDNTNPIEQSLGAFSTLVGMVSSINGLKLQNAQVRKADADADFAEQRTDSDFIKSLDPLLTYRVNHLLSHLPTDWETMTEQQQSDWLNDYWPSSNEGKFLSSGRMLYTGESDLVPDSMLLMKLIGLAKYAKEQGDSAFDIFDSLINLREEQTHNVSEQKMFNLERAKYQEWYNREMAPIIKEIKEIEKDFLGSEKALGVVGGILRTLTGGGSKK